jgi:hypothetical protein
MFLELLFQEIIPPKKRKEPKIMPLGRITPGI